MRTIQQKVYKFEELNKQAQQKAINHFRESFANDWDCDYLLDEFIDYCKEKLGLEIDKKDLVYEISDYRSDKFGINGSALNKAIQNKFNDVQEVDFPTNVGVYISHLGGGICNLNNTEKDSSAITFYECDDDELEDVVRAKVNEEKAQEIQNLINSFIDLCREYYTKIVEDLRYSNSDECIKGNIEANDYEFFDDGSLI